MLLTLFIIISLGFFVLRLMPGSVYDDPESFHLRSSQPWKQRPTRISRS
jgi:ABC-type dipeptide/oligopeptide/nickel transport system permease component